MEICQTETGVVPVVDINTIPGQLLDMLVGMDDLARILAVHVDAQ